MATAQELEQGLRKAHKARLESEQAGDNETAQRHAANAKRFADALRQRRQTAGNVPESMEPVALPQQGPGQQPTMQAAPGTSQSGQPAGPAAQVQTDGSILSETTENIGRVLRGGAGRFLAQEMTNLLFGSENQAQRKAMESRKQAPADWDTGADTSMTELMTHPFGPLGEIGEKVGGGVARWLQSPSDEEIARSRGIETGGAPSDLRGIYQRVPPNLRDGFTQTVVDRYYANKMGKKPTEVNIPTDFDEELGRHIYRDPYDDKWKPLDDIGIDLQDTKQMAKEVLIPSAAGVAASIYTPNTPMGKAAMGNTVDAAVTGWLRSRDVANLQEEGMLPEDVSSLEQGIREGAITFGFGVAGDALLKSLRRAGAGPGAIPADVDVSRQRVNSMLQKWDQRFGQQAQASGTKPTLGHKMQMVAETPEEFAASRAINSYERKLTAMQATQRQILEREEQNKQALEASLQTFMETAGRPSEPRAFRASGLTAEELSDSARRIIGEVEEPVRRQIQALDGQLSQAYQSADAAARQLLDQGLDPTRMPTDVKNVFDVAEENFRRNMDEAYSGIKERAGGEKVFDITPLRDQVRQIRGELSEEGRVANLLFPGSRGVVPGQRVTLGSETPADELGEMEVLFGDAFRRDQSGLMIPESVRQDIQSQSDYDFNTVDKALKSVRQRMRDIGDTSSGEAQRALGKLKRLESTLKDIRVEGLQRIDPELANQQQALDKTYSLGTDILRRGLGKEISDRFLQQRSDGKGLVQPGLFDQVFKGDAGARSMRDLRDMEAEEVVFSGPNTSNATLGLRQNLRSGLLGKLKDYTKEVESRAVGGVARVMPEGSFNRFMKDYGHTVREVLPAAEVRQIESLPQLQRRLQTLEDVHRESVKEIQQFPWGSDYLGDNTAGLFKRTWPSDAAKELDKFDRSQKLREVLRKNPNEQGLLTDYRKLITNDMMKYATEEGRINPAKLSDYVDKHEEPLKEWYTTPGGQSGTAFVNKMRAVADMGTQLLSSEQLRYQDANTMSKVLDTMARAYTGIFTMPGRALTAAKSLYGGRTQAQDADFILNPEKYVRNQEFFDRLSSPWAQAAARDTARGLYEQISDVEGTPTGEQELFPGQAPEEKPRRPIPEPRGRAPDHTLF